MARYFRSNTCQLLDMCEVLLFISVVAIVVVAICMWHASFAALRLIAITIYVLTAFHHCQRCSIYCGADFFLSLPRSSFMLVSFAVIVVVVYLLLLLTGEASSALLQLCHATSFATMTMFCYY